jgi:hypothetical protein
MVKEKTRDLILWVGLPSVLSQRTLYRERSRTAHEGGVAHMGNSYSGAEAASKA